MNFLFISPNSPFDSTGGVERYIHNLLSFCKTEKRHHYFFWFPANSQKQKRITGNTEIHFKEAMALSELDDTQRLEKARQFSSELELFIEEKKIDLICAENLHCSLTPAFSMLLNMVAVQKSIPLVLQLHSYAAKEIQTELINSLMWSKLFCVSKSIAGDCFHKNSDVKKLETNYLGVDTNEFYPLKGSKKELRRKLGLPEDNRIILTASRIINEQRNILKEKGVLKLIQAFSKIAPRYKDTELLIAMGRPPRQLLPRFIEAQEFLEGYLHINNVSERTIPRVFELEEMPDVYRAADMLVLTSENETFGQVFIEAMASGIPVIGSNVGGIPEIITDSYNGFLVPQGDTLAKRIERLLNDGELVDRFVAEGLKTVRQSFSMQKQFSRLIAMLEEQVHAKGGSRVQASVVTLGRTVGPVI